MSDKEYIETLELDIQQCELQAEADEVVAAHFRPRFEAAVHQQTESPHPYYPYVIERERQGKHYRKLAESMRKAVEVLKNGLEIL